jgi:hypothetical protein
MDAMSTETVKSSSQTPGRLMDEPLEEWAPTRMSDRKLVELQTRLEKLKRLGDAFANVDFSPDAKDRLRRIAGG